MDKVKEQWVEELHSILEAYRTIYRLLMGETLFNLTFGTKAVIPLEVGLPSSQIEAYDKWCNSKDLRVNLDLLEEVQIKSK